MQRTNDDLLLAIIKALPADMREKTLPQILADHAKRDPSYWVRPAPRVAVAELFDKSPGALATWEHRAQLGGPPAPPGWRHVEGLGGRYSSRLEVLQWWRAQAGLEQEVAA